MNRPSTPRISGLLAAGFALVILTTAACGGGDKVVEGGVDDYPIVASKSMIETGRVIYAENCAACHGDADTPPPLQIAPPHSVDGHTWHHPDRSLVSMVLFGSNPAQTMPLFNGKLSTEEVRATIAFIKTFWPPEAVQRQKETSEAYEKQLEP